MRHFIYQESEKGCGLACLRMAMIEATGDKNYKYLRFEKHPPYNLKELQELAAKEGGKLTFSKANSKECIYESLSFPCLLLLKEGTSDHMVYAPKRDKTKILIYDPLCGPSWVKIEIIKEKWCLISGNIEIFNKKKSSWGKPKIRPPSSVIISLLTPFLSDLAIFASFYFMQNDANYLISIGFLALSGMIEIIGRGLLMRSMRKFDDEWIERISKSRKKILKERYVRYCSFKKSLYPDMFALMSSLIFSLAIAALFSLNNLIFLIASVTLTVYILLSIFLFQRKMSLSKNLLEKKETRLFYENESEENTLKLLKTINKESYKIGKLNGYEKIIYTIIVSVLALLPLANAQNITLNYYLLHFAGLYALGESLKNVILYFSEKEQRERETLYFYEYFYND